MTGACANVLFRDAAQRNEIGRRSGQAFGDGRAGAEPRSTHVTNVQPPQRIDLHHFEEFEERVKQNQVRMQSIERQLDTRSRSGSSRRARRRDRSRMFAMPRCRGGLRLSKRSLGPRAQMGLRRTRAPTLSRVEMVARLAGEGMERIEDSFEKVTMRFGKRARMIGKGINELHRARRRILGLQEAIAVIERTGGTRGSSSNFHFRPSRSLRMYLGILATSDKSLPLLNIRSPQALSEALPCPSGCSINTGRSARRNAVLKLPLRRGSRLRQRLASQSALIGKNLLSQLRLKAGTCSTSAGCQR